MKRRKNKNGRNDKTNPLDKKKTISYSVYVLLI